MSAGGLVDADDLAGAVALVARGWTPLGGGAALASRAFPAVRAPGSLVDLRPLGLDGLDAPRIGAGVTLARLAADPAVAAGWPAVAAAAAATATPGVRALATVGGTVAARLVGCDLAAALDLHDTTVELVGPDGPRMRPFGEHWADPDPGPALVVALTLGPAAPGCYRRAAGRQGPAPAVATVAGLRRPDGTIVLRAGAVADRPVPVDPATGSVTGGAVLRSDHRASAAQRARLVRALALDVVAGL